MAAISATEVRSNFSEILGRVDYCKERVTIERRGRHMDVLLPIADLARLEAGFGGGPASACNILSAVADNIPGTIYQRVQYPDGREEYSYISPGIRDTVGIEPEAMLSDPATLNRAIHPKDRDLRARAIADSARTLSPYDVQYRVCTPAGETKWLHAVAWPERRADGAIVWTGLTLDITRWNETGAALRENEARLRDLIDGSIEGILIHRGHKPVMVNEAWAVIHGCTAEEVLTMESVMPLISPDERERMIGYRDARLRGEAMPQRYECRALRQDGSEIWLEQLVRVVDWEGAPAIQSVVIDITERKSAEAALEGARDELERRVEERTRELHATNRALEEEVGTRKAVEERLRESERDLWNLIEGSVQGVVIVTEDRKPRFANQAYAEIFGYDSPAEILDLENNLPLIAPYEVARLDQLRNPYFAGQEAPISYEFDGLRKDGATIRLQCMARGMTWRGERVVQTTLYDITERKRAERALRESEERFRLLTEIAPVGIFETDISGDNTFVNDKWCELAGLSPEQAAGPGWVAALHPEDRERVSTEWYTATTNNQMFRSEYRFRRPDGEVSWLIGQGRNVTDAAGHMTGFVGTLTDITERRHAEQALRESEERLRQATELAGLGHCIWDSVEDRCLFCSEDYARIHGVTPEEYIARAATPDGRFNHPDDRDAYRAAIAALRRGEPFELEYRVITPKGEVRYVREAAKPIFDESGAVAQEFCTIQDITERRKAEETVRTRDLWLRAILENAPIQIVLKDTEGRIMAISRNAAETHGVPMDELVGRTTADFLPRRVAEAYMSTDREVVETGRVIQQEVVEDWDGVTRHLLNSKFPLRDDSGQIVGVCSLTNDMTEVKQSEERLRQAQKMEAVGQLTGGVAHDFNNLLAVILGNTEMLGERLGAKDRQVAAVMRAAERGAELTQRLLAFSRRQPLKPQEIDLAGRVAGMTELLTRTLGATIEISVASTPGLWRALADPGQLENALLNLAINARDAMTEGGRLSISTTNASLEPGEIAALLAGQALEAADGEPGDPGDYVVLSVSDNGTGMSPAVLARVFEPFFTTKGVGQGSGLGLSMVYGFARQSGGFAAIESAPGRGTTVRLYLPRAVVAAPAPGARDRAGQLPHGHGETVLLLEDAQDVRELAAALLEALGYRVLAAAEAAEAGALLAENPGVALLLTDVILPGGCSGPDFAETARRHNPALKVLFMSGYPTEALTQRGDRLAQDTALLIKPFRKAILAKAVREVLDDGAEVDGTEGSGPLPRPPGSPGTEPPNC